MQIWVSLKKEEEDPNASMNHQNDVQPHSRQWIACLNVNRLGLSCNWSKVKLTNTDKKRVIGRSNLNLYQPIYITVRNHAGFIPYP
jgi:hypothetical protein